MQASSETKYTDRKSLASRILGVSAIPGFVAGAPQWHSLCYGELDVLPSSDTKVWDH
jgi:hypothetical protein